MIRFLVSFLVTSLIFNFYSYASTDFEFKTSLNFNHQLTLVKEKSEIYSLESNEKVKLFVTLLDNKNLFNEASSLNDAHLKTKLLNNADSLDPLNSQENRKVIFFSTLRTSSQLIINIKYSVLKNSELWYDSNLFILEKNNAAIAKIRFPASIEKEIQKELNKSIDNFKLKGTNKTVFHQLNTIYKNALNNIKKNISERADFLNHSFGELLIDASFANYAEKKFKNCHQDEYILKGEFTNKPGSAIFKFNKITSDIKAEVQKISVAENEKQQNIDYTKLSCLMNYFQEAKEKSAEYWMKRGEREGCFDETNEIISSPNETCSEKTLELLNGSLKYIENIEKNLNDFIQAENPYILSCNQQADLNQEELDTFKKLGANAQQAMCCSSGEGKTEKGALFKILENELAYPEKATLAYKVEHCLQKTIHDSASGKDFLSINGVADCISNVVQGFGSYLEDMLDSILSLADWETYSAIGTFIMDLPDSGKKLIDSLYDQISSQVDAVSNCMNPYEQKQYICKLIPQVAASILTPTAILKTVKLIKKGGSALNDFLKKEVSENKKIKQLNEPDSSKKATSSSTLKSVKKSSKATGIISSFLAKNNKSVFEMIKEGLKKQRQSNSKKETKKGTIITKKDARADTDQEFGNVPNNLPTEKKEIPLESNKSEKNEKTTSLTLTSTTNQKGNLTSQQNQKVIFTDDEFGSSPSIALQSSRANPTSNYGFSQERLDTLSASAKLTDSERVTSASKLLNKKLSPNQEKAILDAHNIGASEGRGYFEYTKEDLLKKTRTLKDADFDKDEIRKLMESGLTGKFSSNSFFRTAVLDYMKKMTDKSTFSSTQENVIIKIAEMKRPTDLKLFTETVLPELRSAGFTELEAKRIAQGKFYNDNGKAKEALESVERNRLASRNKPATLPQAKSNSQTPSVLTLEEKIIKGFETDSVYSFKAGSSKADVDKAIKDVERRFGEFNPASQIQDDIAELYKHKSLREEANEILKNTTPDSPSYLKAQEQLDKSKAYEKIYKQRCQNWFELQKAKYDYTDQISPFLKRCLEI